MGEGTMLRQTAQTTAIGALCFLVAFALAFPIGCNDAQTSPETELNASGNSTSASEKELKPIRGLTAERVLADAVDVYSRAKVYSDRGQVVATYELENSGVKRAYSQPCSLSFAKPNYIDLRSGSARLRSDGRRARAEIENDENGGEAIEYDAPIIVSSIKDLCPNATFAKAAQLNIPSGAFTSSPQAILLFASDPLRTLVPESSQKSLLEPEYLEIDGTRRPCERVQVVDDAGTRVYWFDRDAKTLARCDLPVKGIKAPDPNARVLSVSIEFKRQHISDEPVADRSSYRLEEREVERFGFKRFSSTNGPTRRRFPRETLKALDGDGDATERFEGRKTRLYLWRQEDAVDEKARLFRALNARTASEDENGPIRVAVNCDDASVPDELVRSAAADAGILAPSFRLDRDALKRTERALSEIASPAIVELDENDVVQRVVKADLSFDRAKELNAIDDRLKKLKDEREKNAALIAADENDLFRTTTQTIEPSPLTRRPPKTFDLLKVWSVEDLIAPNEPALATFIENDAKNGAASETSVAIVPCDGNALAIVSSQGRLLRKTTPKSAAGEPIDFIKTTRVGANERVYVAASDNSEKLHRFDAEFNDLGTLDLGAVERKIADAELVEIDESPIAILALRGADSNELRAIDARSRKTLWKNETVEEPERLAVLDRKLIVAERASEKVNALIAIDPRSGERNFEFRVDENETIEDLAVSQRNAAIVALTSDDEGRERLYCVDASGEQLWRVALGNERQARPGKVESADVDRDGTDEFFVASANGSIRFFRSNGKQYDSLQYGERFSSAIVADWDNESYLLVAEQDKFSAFKIEKKR